MSLPEYLTAKVNEHVSQVWPPDFSGHRRSDALVFSHQQIAHICFYGYDFGSPQWLLDGMTPVGFECVLEQLEKRGRDVAALKTEIRAYFEHPQRRVEDLQILEDRESEAKRQVATFKQQWVKDRCPHKPGTLFTVPRGAYSFVGRQAVLESVGMRHNGLNWVWHLHARVLTKADAALRAAVPAGHPLPSKNHSRSHFTQWDMPIDGLDYNPCSSPSLSSSAASSSGSVPPASPPDVVPGGFSSSPASS